MCKLRTLHSDVLHQIIFVKDIGNDICNFAETDRMHD